MIKKVLNRLMQQWYEEFLETKNQAKEKITDKDIRDVLRITPARRLEFREAFKEEYDLYDVDEEQRELICDMAEASAFGTKDDVKKALGNHRRFMLKS